MFTKEKSFLNDSIEKIKTEGLFKKERIITSPQQANVDVLGGKTVLNMCANNYLGLANNPEIIKAAKESYDKWGYGLSSVRFICGTQEIHKELEAKISDFLRNRGYNPLHFLFRCKRRIIRNIAFRR